MSNIFEIKQIGQYFWQVKWTGTPPFRVFRDGREYSKGNVLDYSYIVQGDDTEDAPIIEVLEVGDVSFLAPYQSWMMLQWRNVIDAEVYRVQKYIGGEWITIAAPLRNTNEPYIEYTTTELSDNTQYSYRVIAIDRLGNLSTVETLTFTHHRIPPAPDVTISWNSGAGKFQAVAR